MSVHIVQYTRCDHAEGGVDADVVSVRLGVRVRDGVRVGVRDFVLVRVADRDFDSDFVADRDFVSDRENDGVFVSVRVTDSDLSQNATSELKDGSHNNGGSSTNDMCTTLADDRAGPCQ